MNQHTGAVLGQFLRDSGVGAGDEAGPVGIGVRRVVGHCPQGIVSAAGSDLVPVEDVKAVGAVASGVVKGVQHQLGAFFAVGGVDLRVADVVADGQTDF